MQVAINRTWETSDKGATVPVIIPTVLTTPIKGLQSKGRSSQTVWMAIFNHSR